MVSHVKLLLTGCFLSLCGLCASSATLDQTAFKILVESPQFQSEIYSLESVEANLKTESNLPDPELGGEYLVMPTDVDNRWAVQLTWGLEWPGVYGARSQESKSKYSAAQKELIAQRAEKLAEIKDLLLDYIRSYQKLVLLEELTNNNDTICRLAENAARDGEMSVLDLNKVKLEYANIRVAKAALLDEQADVVGNLSSIYGRDCLPILEEMECKFPEVKLPSEEEIAMIKENAPAIQSALAQADAARRGKKVASMEALPSISIGYKHAFEDAMHFNGAVLGVSIPIFSSRGKQKAVKADILDAEFKAETLSQEIDTEAWTTYQRLLLIHSQIEEIAPLVEDVNYNTALLKAYKNGVITLIEYISDRNYFTNAAVELVSLRHNEAKALAFLQRFMHPAEL